MAKFLQNLSGEYLESIMITRAGAKEKNWENIYKFCAKNNISLSPEQIRGILSQDYVSILKLLINVNHRYPSVYKLPSNVTIALVYSESVSGYEQSKTVSYDLTGDEVLFSKNSSDRIYRKEMNSFDQNVEDAIDKIFRDGNEEKQKELQSV